MSLFFNHSSAIPITENQNSTIVETQSLKYCTMTTNDNMNNILDVVTKEIQEELAKEKDLFDTKPQMAVINVERKNTTEASNSSNDHSLADAMQVADYSVYNEQVNC